jgi:hypothetical protein
MFALIGLSAAALCGGLAVAFFLNLLLLKFVGPLYVYLANGLLITYLWRPAMRTAWWIAAAMWNPFLNYYGYEAHSLKPIKPKEDDPE